MTTAARRKSIVKAAGKAYEAMAGPKAEDIRTVQDELYRLEIQVKAYEQALIAEILEPTGSEEAAGYMEKYLEAKHKQEGLKYCLLTLKGLGAV